MMDAIFPPIAIDRVEAITSAISAFVYLAVGLAALAKAPRDIRVRTFFVLALTGLGPYLAPVWLWRQGDQAEFTKPLILVLVLSVALAGVALFHFMQVFPWRRRWVRDHMPWLKAAYVVCPALGTALVLVAPDRLDEMTPEYALTVFVLGLPLIVLVGIVLPFAGLLSLYDSWRTAKRLDMTAAKRPAFAMLISQLAGGLLAIVVVPLLHFLLPPGPWTGIAAGFLFGFGLLMPVAFAAAIWHDRVLQIDPGLIPAEAASG